MDVTKLDAAVAGAETLSKRLDAVEARRKDADKKPGDPDYNEEAVNKAIAASARQGQKIGGKEQKAIHSLLKGRH